MKFARIDDKSTRGIFTHYSLQYISHLIVVYHPQLYPICHLHILCLTFEVNIVCAKLDAKHLIRWQRFMSRRRRQRIKKLPAAQIAARDAVRLQRLNEVKINHGGYSPQTTALMRHESIGYGKKWPKFPELYQLTEKHVPELLFILPMSHLRSQIVSLGF